MPIRFFKQTICLLTSTSDTNGVLGAIEVASPRGGVPPLHVHRREDEAFYVLEGEYSVFIGDDVIAAAAGTWVWAPRDVPHGYQVHSERGRHLSLTMPGGFEAFFEEGAAFATPEADPRNEMSRLAALAARYGVELLGPAPAPRSPSTTRLARSSSCSEDVRSVYGCGLASPHATARRDVNPRHGLRSYRKDMP